MTRRWQTWALALVLGGCTGVLSVERGDTDSGVVIQTPDAAPGVDAGSGVDAGPGVDAGTPAPDAGRDAGRDSGPVDPCAGVTCGANARCVSGACRCDEGFVEMGGACVALPPGDPAGRTQAEVCDAWRTGHVENASPAWTAGPTTCDPGTMAPAAIDDTLRRVNMFRWLAGLGPVPHDASRHQELMECAHMMSVNGMLSHSPPSGWTCYTSGGAAAAGRSNIALGYPTPGAAIDGYMADSRTPSLGHRRWILSGRLGNVEIGFAGRGQCLGVFGSGGSTDRQWTAYPNQGYAPIQTASYTWSFHVNSITLSRDATAEVVRVSDGATLPVDSYYIEGLGPPVSLGFTPNGWRAAAGETYRVTIRGTSAGDVTYEVHVVSC